MFYSRPQSGRSFVLSISCIITLQSGISDSLGEKCEANFVMEIILK